MGGFGLGLDSVLRFIEKTVEILPGGECMAQRNSQEKKEEMRTEQRGKPGWLFGVTGRDRTRDGRARSLSDFGGTTPQPTMPLAGEGSVLELPDRRRKSIWWKPR